VKERRSWVCGRKLVVVSFNDFEMPPSPL
jgi:hypothetical protein